MRSLITFVLVLGFFSRSLAQSPKTSDSAPAAKPSDTLSVLSPDPEDTLPVNKKDLGSLSALKAITIGLVSSEKVPPSGFASLFNHFEIIDERPDTARIGVHAATRYGIGTTHNRQLIFAGPAAREISSYLDARFAHPGAPYTALIVIRTLWISDANNKWDEMTMDPDKYDEKAKIRLKAEIYAAKNDLYTPVFRFDSLNVSLKSSFARLGRDLAEMLEELADSSTLLLARKGEGSRKISRADILAFNQSRFDPLICKGAPLVKGVYMNFEEFKNNAPSVQNFEIKKEKRSLLLYLKEAGGNTYYSHNAWGYCDGKMIYVMRDGILVPSWKEGKTWYLFGQVQTMDPRNQNMPGYYSSGSTVGPGGGTGAPLIGSNANGLSGPDTQKHIFTVDMDSGVLY
jgi:hypothetical protein